MDQGQIPLRVRLGVTGQPGPAEDAVIEGAVREALAALRRHLSPTGRTPIVFTVISSLAEGSDQLATHAALAEGGDLEVFLPCEPDEYAQSFSSDVARQRFRRLLARATSSGLVAPAAEKDAWHRTGEYIVDRADVLLAVHDHHAGPADQVAEPRWRALPTLRVDSRTGHVSVELGRGALLDAAREFESLNRPIRPATFEGIRAIGRARLLSNEGPPVLEDLADRVLPYFVRADLLANKYQARYHLVGTSVFCLAAGAITAAATGAVFSSAELAWGRVEVALLLVVLAVFRYGGRQRVIPRWLWYRSLAERLRSAFYLAAAGVQGAPERLGAPISLENWVVRAGDEVWRTLPRAPTSPAAVGQSRMFLVSWIRGQIDYHDRAKQVHERAHERTTRWVWAVVISVTGLAIVHASGVIDHHSPVAKWVTLSTIALPAWGAAIAGSSELKEHRHYKERSAVMRRSLMALAAVMERAETPDDLTKGALQADAVMRQDAEGWMGVMSVHDVPLPT